MEGPPPPRWDADITPFEANHHWVGGANWDTYYTHMFSVWRKADVDHATRHAATVAPVLSPPLSVSLPSTDPEV